MNGSNQFPIQKKEKSNRGKLWYNGKVLISDKPFAILQCKKKKLVATGYYRKELFKITY